MQQTIKESLKTVTTTNSSAQGAVPISKPIKQFTEYLTRLLEN